METDGDDGASRDRHDASRAGGAGRARGKGLRRPESAARTGRRDALARCGARKSGMGVEMGKRTGQAAAAASGSGNID